MLTHLVVLCSTFAIPLDKASSSTLPKLESLSSTSMLVGFKRELPVKSKVSSSLDSTAAMQILSITIIILSC